MQLKARFVLVSGCLLGLLTLSTRGQEVAPVVGLRQPLRLASSATCRDVTCALGTPCATCSATADETAGPVEAFSLTMPRCDHDDCAEAERFQPVFCETGCPTTLCRDWTCANLCRCDPCNHGFWVRTDYLLWWLADDDIPPLVTSSPLGTAIDEVGILGLPTTTTQYDGPLSDSVRSGGRISFGYWLQDCVWALEGSLWGLENLHDDRTFSSNGSPAYARPFFNVDPTVNAIDAELVSFDGLLNGAVSVNTSSEVYSGNLGLRHCLRCCGDRCDAHSARVDWIAGYRFFRLREGVRISESLVSTSLAGPVIPGTTIDLFDRFRTANEFHGGEIGLVAATQRGRWYGELLGKVALGNLHREVRIDGTTTTAVPVPGVPAFTSPGGLLAQPSNIGSYDDDRFAAIPELQANIGFNLTCDLRLLFGYTFLYLGDVVRPGDAIDPVVNGTFLDPGVPNVGPQRPQFTWRDSDLWVMGMNFGLECRF